MLFLLEYCFNQDDMEEIGIAIGSNIGDRWEHLMEAISFLKKLSRNDWIEVSPFYETSPVDCPEGSSSFLNAVVIIKSDEVPKNLLKKLKQFEREQGRDEIYEKNSPRPLDLDILFLGNQLIKDEVLTVPHPRLLERRFVLQPLCDIRPNLILPGETKPLHYFLSNLITDEEVIRVENKR